MPSIADLKRHGKDGLEIRCAGCGWTTITWWRLLHVSDGEDLADLVGRLRCKRCGIRPDPRDVRPYGRGEEQPGRLT
jgi:hypothetical protein